MTPSQVIPLLIFIGIVILYLWGTTKFRRGWAHRCVPVKGGKLNVLLVIAIIFVVVVFLVRTTIH